MFYNILFAYNEHFIIKIMHVPWAQTSYTCNNVIYITAQDFQSFRYFFLETTTIITPCCDITTDTKHETQQMKNIKVSFYIFIYILLYQLLGTQSALHFTTWQTYSHQHQLKFSGKHSATPQLVHNKY